MATKKDLVEAHAFSRRRLVTAFVSGAPGGREVEPVRPGRVLIGGAALSVLLLAGAAIAGFLLGRPPAEWLSEGSFVISKDTGEQYVVMRGGDDAVLQRVPNYVSAQLLLGNAELTPYTVRDKYIRNVELGEDLGIEGAPASLPEPEALVHDGWTACTAEGRGIQVRVQEGREVQDVTGSAFLVRTGRQRWLIAPSPEVDGRAGTAYRFALPKSEPRADTLADELGFDPTAPEVEKEWLNLFPEGATLDASAFGVRGGARYPESGADATDLSAYRVGDLLEETESGRFYLLGNDGPQSLDPFAAEVYEAVRGAALPLEEGLRGNLDEPDHPREWPETVPEALSPDTLCAVLHPGDDTVPSRTLAVNPTDAAAPDDALGPGQHDVDVEPSGGAFVLSSSDEAVAGGTAYVIDSKGSKYQLVGPEVPDDIGYGSVSPPIVPSAWLSFFEPGVLLSTNKARNVPEDAPAGADDEAATS